MEFIAHRINTVQELQSVPKDFGVEVDLRDYGNQLILQHDPFKDGERFSEFLKYYRNQTLILNIKSERIEWETLKLIKKFRIQKYFFLDSSLPMIVRLIKEGEKNIAVRFSEYEKIDTVLSFKKKVQWVWVDCFSKFPLDRKIYQMLKKAGFKLCLVSPELQGREKDIPAYKQFLIKEGIKFDAVCAKLYAVAQWNHQ